MPLVRIDLARGKSTEFRATLGTIVHTAMVETINVPKDDRFQVISEHPTGELQCTPAYLGIDYTADLVLIQITLSVGRSVELKKALFARIAGDLKAQLGHRPEDVMISLIEVTKENWSFGNGIAQYAG